LIDDKGEERMMLELRLTRKFKSPKRDTQPR